MQVFFIKVINKFFEDRLLKQRQYSNIRMWNVLILTLGQRVIPALENGKDIFNTVFFPLLYLPGS